MSVRWKHLTLSALMGALTLSPSGLIAEPSPSSGVATAPKPRTELSPALKRMNSMMHSALREVVQAERQQLGPLIMFEAGHMKLFRGDEEVIALPASPPLVYHQLKVIGHVVFTTVIQLWRADLKGAERSEWLRAFGASLDELSAELPSYGLPKELERSQARLLIMSAALVKRALGAEPISREELRRFSAEARPLLKAGFEHSAKAHIDLLHARAGELYALLTPEERGQVRGYFYGGRGARVDNLAMQYVSWLIGERTGHESGRLIFSEGVRSKDKALALLAQYSVERELAELVFDDPNGLHRDVLGEATRAYLSTFPDAAELFSKERGAD